MNKPCELIPSEDIWWKTKDILDDNNLDQIVVMAKTVSEDGHAVTHVSFAGSDTDHHYMASNMAETIQALVDGKIRITWIEQDELDELAEFDKRMNEQ